MVGLGRQSRTRTHEVDLVSLQCLSQCSWQPPVDPPHLDQCWRPPVDPSHCTPQPQCGLPDSQKHRPSRLGRPLPPPLHLRVDSQTSFSSKVGTEGFRAATHPMLLGRGAAVSLLQQSPQRPSKDKALIQASTAFQNATWCTTVSADLLKGGKQFAQSYQGNHGAHHSQLVAPSSGPQRGGRQA